jgi:CheY-like chemotaxis protein
LAGTARDGAAALEAVVRLAPDLVIIDAFMPVMDGFAATRHLKSSPIAPWIVMVSVHEGSTIENEAWAAGADAFVAKSNLATQMPSIIRALSDRTTATETRRDDGAASPGTDAAGVPVTPTEERAIDPRSIFELVLGLVRGLQFRPVTRV